MGILTACEPRKDILAGSFNPEIFTASLSAVVRHYRERASGVHLIYADARQFFTDATYPTDGLRMVLSDVFGRIRGDNSVPAIHRLETAFGGGKTHTLIACTHIALGGSDLKDVTRGVISYDLLPEPGQVSVVGVAGDELPVHKPRGTSLVPYTLWGEIAFQVGGKALYQQIEEEAASYAAPGKTYFDAVFKGRKTLIMLDELAQYAARLTAARPDGGEQLAAFLMSLHGYVRTNSGIAVVLTLAGTADAFANQTQRLASLLSDVTGSEVNQDAALGIGQRALKGVSSVVARDASPVVPVQAAEISRVLGKRLFTGIDEEQARKTVDAYFRLYAKHTSVLPFQAGREDYRDRMAAHYPFHPTLIDFLTNKLAASETFQGTRGMLRVLTLAVRSLWKRQIDIPMIHACHMDLREARTVSELIGRTGGSELLPVLNADIGGADTEGIEGGRSNAELADLRNPHPEGWPMYEYTWKTVFLHSLVGREEGFGSNLFGLTEQEAIFNVTFPGLTPPQVGEALKEIEHSAFYLRFNQGRYYASLDPSINRALARIRRSLGLAEIDEALDAVARKVVSSDVRTFTVVTDVSAPEHIPDRKGKPVLALASLNAGSLDVAECVTMAGPNTPRLEQNLVFLLVPDTVSSKSETGRKTFFDDGAGETEAMHTKLRDTARTVISMQKLSMNPQAHGINPRKFQEEDFRKRFSEREKALETAVTQCFKSLWFSSASGQIAHKEIRTAGGEGGLSVFEQIRKILLDEGELVTEEHTTQSHLGNLKKLFFDRTDTIQLSKLRENFSRLRTWPILDSPSVLDQLIRAGVVRGVWCLFRMGSDEVIKPDEFYSRETGELPFDLDLGRDYAIVTPEGARKRGWTKDSGPDLTRVPDWVREALSEKHAATVNEIKETVVNKYGEVPAKAFNEAVAKLVQAERIISYKGRPDQEEKPAELISGTGAVFFNPEESDVLVTPAKAAERGWIAETPRGFSLSGKDGAKVFLPLLNRIGSLYNRGASSTIDSLDMTDLELPKGGRLRLSVFGVPPESVKDLSELFEVVAALTRSGDDTELFLDIDYPKDGCAFVQELTNRKKDV
jgi:hypothetical protein